MQRFRVRAFAIAVTAGACLAVPLLAGAGRTAQPARFAYGTPATGSYKCLGQPIRIFSNANAGPVQGGGAAPTFSTHGHTYCVLSIATKHSVARAVSIGLGVVKGVGGNGNTFGPLPATGAGGVWTATVPSGTPAVINGTYACHDSAPATWAQNTGSRHLGFCTVYANAAVRTAAAPVGKVAWSCQGNQQTVFDNSNGQGVTNNAQAPLFNTWKLAPQGIQAYCLTQIRTYHYNNGAGTSAPGRVGLQRQAFATGQNVPPRQAKGSAGQGGVRNANWEVDVPLTPAPTVIAGFYRCSDSDPATWSWNSSSQDATKAGRGFCTVYGVPAYPMWIGLPHGIKFTLPPRPPVVSGAATNGGGTATSCANSVPTNFLVSPDHVAPLGTTSLLLGCSIPTALGFTGRLAPVAVFMIGAGCAPFFTYTPGTGFIGYTGPPGAPCAGAETPLPFMVVGPHDVDVTVPQRQAPGPYVVYVAWTGGDAASMNDLTVT